MLNCPNCGAPIDPQKNKCDYCGTSYYDLTAIDFDNCKPVYLKLNLNNIIFTTKCIPKLGSVNCYSDTVDATTSNGTIIKRFVTNRHLDVDISFESVPDINGSLFVNNNKE